MAHIPTESVVYRCVFGVLIAALLANTAPSGPPLPKLIEVELFTPSRYSRSLPFDARRVLRVPEGFGIEVFARVPNARFLLALPGGDVLVSQPNEGKVSLVQVVVDNDDWHTEVTDFKSGLNRPHDMVLYNGTDGQSYIYIAEADKVVRYPYTEGDKVALPGQVIVDGLPFRFEGKRRFRHPLKNIAVQNNTLYISIGSSSNDDIADLNMEPKHGAIYAYNAEDGSNRRLVAEGIRNAEGLAFAPDTQELWVVVNQRDNIKYPYIDGSRNHGKVVAEFVDENPPEEFVRVVEGARYSWPYCNPMGKSGERNLPFVADVDRNPNETLVSCSVFQRVDVALEPHSAPLGFGFWTGKEVHPLFKNSAVIGLHGSWNRRTFSGHKVLLFTWKNGQPSQQYDLVSGFVLDPVNKTRWGRPVDTAPLEDGSLLISDDYSGSLYRLYKTN